MAGANMEQFEAFFKRADLDGDERISGAEAVSFFQGANLPKPVLAQIWTYADQNRTGFLGRPEFFNALRLVTVAQSKRDLTPDIVKAALYGPAAAKIPAPKIDLPSTPAPQVNPMPSGSMPQMGAVGPTVSQHFGFRGPGVPNATVNQNYFTPQQGQLMRPPQATSGASLHAPVQSFTGQDFSRGGGMPGQSQPIPAGAASRPSLSMRNSTIGPNLSNINTSTGWSSGLGSGLLPTSGGVSPSASPVTASLQPLTPVSPQPAATGSKSVPVSGNGAANDPFLSGNMFPATQPPRPALLATSTPVSSTMVPISTGSQISKSNSLDSLQSAFAIQPLGGKPSRTQSLPNTAQQASASPASSNIPAGVGNSSSTPQIPWPKMKPTDIQKYTKVFMEVDIDRDGRITGEQARNLFLSWRLPREVLKQVWDLSDQDSDSMLSLREFCFALYLMERYREGRPLPTALPNTVMYDETLLSMTGQLKAPQGVPAWGANPGFGQRPGMGPQQMGPATGLRQPAPVGGHQPVRPVMPNQQETGAPVLEDSFLNQRDGADQSSANSMPQHGVPLEKKVDGPEKVILDSKEKIEFYRSKMQELVLYKSRCDNRLNEITERALADKREAEMLGKKYEEKYKQVAEVASKLTIEEAAYRDTQERKVELEQAIINVEKGGSMDGILQVRADRIQSDLDELLKALTERCKKHGLEVKSAAVIELPKGWQPGIREDAAVWDEEWDKFEDEGFTNELKVDVKNVPSPKQNGSLSPDFSSNDDEKGNFFNTSEHTHESGSAKTQSEDEYGKSTLDSPSGRTASESPARDFSDVFAKSSEADAETHRVFDDSTWGVFDGHDDADSVWGFNPSKESDSGNHGNFFGSGDFGASTRTESPTSESPFQKKSIFFEESVAGSPRYSEAGDHFDSFSRFDTFSVNEGGFSPQREKFTRFDSISSSKDFGHSSTSFSYDDMDPFGSSGPFKVSSSNQSPRKGSDNWSSF